MIILHAYRQNNLHEFFFKNTKKHHFAIMHFEIWSYNLNWVRLLGDSGAIWDFRWQNLCSVILLWKEPPKTQRLASAFFLFRHPLAASFYSDVTAAVFFLSMVSRKRCDIVKGESKLFESGFTLEEGSVTTVVILSSSKHSQIWHRLPVFHQASLLTYVWAFTDIDLYKHVVVRESAIIDTAK